MLVDQCDPRRWLEFDPALEPTICVRMRQLQQRCQPVGSQRDFIHLAPSLNFRDILIQRAYYTVFLELEV